MPGGRGLSLWRPHVVPRQEMYERIQLNSSAPFTLCESSKRTEPCCSSRPNVLGMAQQWRNSSLECVPVTNSVRTGLHHIRCASGKYGHVFAQPCWARATVERQIQAFDRTSRYLELSEAYNEHCEHHLHAQCEHQRRCIALQLHVVINK